MAALKQKLKPPTLDSDANLWISWYDQAESEFGKRDAMTAFVTRWNNLKAGKIGAVNTSDFRSKMADRGINIEADGIAGTLLDEAKSITNTVGDFLKLGAMGTYAIGAIMLIFVLLIVWRLAKPEAVGTVIKYAK